MNSAERERLLAEIRLKDRRIAELEKAQDYAEWALREMARAIKQSMENQLVELEAYRVLMGISGRLDGLK